MSKFDDISSNFSLVLIIKRYFLTPVNVAWHVPVQFNYNTQSNDVSNFDSFAPILLFTFPVSIILPKNQQKKTWHILTNSIQQTNCIFNLRLNSSTQIVTWKKSTNKIEHTSTLTEKLQRKFNPIQNITNNLYRLVLFPQIVLFQTQKKIKSFRHTS